MKLASLLVLIPLSLMSVSAMANVSEVKGKTHIINVSQCNG